MGYATAEKLLQSTVGLVVALMALLCVESARAQDDSRIFTSFGVAVDARAPTAAQARDQALLEAEKKAFRMLVYKLAGDEALSRMPELSADDIRALVQSLEVVDERASATRYLATFNIAFIPHRIRELFGTARIRFSELGSEPILLLPVLKYAGGRSLSGDNNPWQQAWQEADLQNRLYDYVFPEKDEAAQVSARLADLAYDPESLKQLAVRFGASDVLIARSVISDPSSRAGDEVAATFELLSRPKIRERIRVRARPGENFQQAMTRLANIYLDRADSRWRERTVLTFGESFTLQARLSLETIGDWAKIRAALLRTPIIRDVTVDWLALPVSSVTLRYVGGNDQLSLSLDQEGLALVRNDRGEWWIVPAETVTAERGEGGTRK